MSSKKKPARRRQVAARKLVELSNKLVELTDTESKIFDAESSIDNYADWTSIRDQIEQITRDMDRTLIQFG